MPISVPKTLRVMTTSTPHRYTKKTANESRWGAHAVLLWLYAGWGTVFLHQGLSGQCARGAQSG